MFWPRRFTVYVLGDVIQLFVVMLVGLTSFIMLGVVLHSMIANDLGVEVFTQLLPYASVMSLQFAIPSSLLFAVCTVFGRISADNEITAIKSCGISPLEIVKPTLIFALIISPLAVWVIELAVSWGLPGIQRVVSHSLEATVYRTLKKNRSYTSQAGIAIHVQDVEGRWLIKPNIQNYSGGGVPANISAERGKISLNPANESLTIELEKYVFDQGDKLILDGGQDTLKLELPLTKAAQRNKVSSSASMIPLRDIGSKRRELTEQLDEHRAAMLSRCSMALASGRLAWLHDQKSEEHRVFAKSGNEKMLRLKAEPWRRWAQGFSCFCFVFMGIPLAIRLKTADFTATFGVCFLAILVLYYPLFILGTDKAKGGEWHVSGPWLANLALVLIGARMLRRIYRE